MPLLLLGSSFSSWNKSCSAKYISLYCCARTSGFVFQRDFGIYIVNAFDTGIAASVLGFPEGSSLKKVLKGLFGVEKQEELTRADWTQRWGILFDF